MLQSSSVCRRSQTDLLPARTCLPLLSERRTHSQRSYLGARDWLRNVCNRVIDLAVGSGAYKNPSEVLDQALAIIREQLDLEDWMLEEKESIAAHIERGFLQAERGELIDGDAAFEILRRRREQRLKSQG